MKILEFVSDNIFVILGEYIFQQTTAILCVPTVLLFIRWDQNQKIEKPNNLEVFGSKQTIGLNKIPNNNTV